MKEPIKPNEEECCNSGCNPCILDVYEKQLQLYKKYQQGAGLTIQDENAISQLEYTTFIVVENISICEEHRLIAFKLNCNERKNVWWKLGSYFLMKYISEGSQLTRAYTPLKINSYIDKHFDFVIIVKKYNNGIVSKYLCGLKEGEETLWRGPYGAYELNPHFNRIIMIAQGTGIAPFLSIVEQILNDENYMTKIILFYCCQSLDKVLFRQELYSFKSYWNFIYSLFISDKTDLGLKYQEPVIYRKLSLKDFDELKPFSEKDQCLLCGSEEFMNTFKAVLNLKIPKENIILF